MKQPLVSVIVPCFNQAHFLPDAVRSLQAQTYRNWECIIVNDGSTDDTGQISAGLAADDSRVKVVSQTNRGLSGARNTGIRASQGEYLQFLDADDKLETEKLKSQAHFLSENSGVDIVYSNARYFTTAEPSLRLYGLRGSDASWTATEEWISKLWHSGTPLLKILVSGRNLMPVNAPMLRRRVVEGVGYWDERLRANEDWEYWLRCAARNVKFQYFDAVNALALVRSHAQSMSRNRQPILQYRYLSRLYAGRYLEDSLLKFENYRCCFDILSEWGVRKFGPMCAMAWANRSSRVMMHFTVWMLQSNPCVRGTFRWFRHLVRTGRGRGMGAWSAMRRYF